MYFGRTVILLYSIERNKTLTNLIAIIIHLITYPTIQETLNITKGGDQEETTVHSELAVKMLTEVLIDTDSTITLFLFLTNTYQSHISRFLARDSK